MIVISLPRPPSIRSIRSRNLISPLEESENIIDQRVNRIAGSKLLGVSGTAQVSESLSLTIGSPSILVIEKWETSMFDDDDDDSRASNLHRSICTNARRDARGWEGRAVFHFRSNDVEKRWMKAPREIFRRVVPIQFRNVRERGCPSWRPRVRIRGTTLDFSVFSRFFSFLFFSYFIRSSDETRDEIL